MTSPMPSYAPALPTTTRRLRDAVLVSLAVVLALLALYAVFLDQGQLLTPLLGKMSATGNYLHEFAHDGRHVLGAPCH